MPCRSDSRIIEQDVRKRERRSMAPGERGGYLLRHATAHPADVFAGRLHSLRRRWLGLRVVVDGDGHCGHSVHDHRRWLGHQSRPHRGYGHLGRLFWRKLSPLSDTTNLAAAVSETGLFDHVRAMISATIPVFLVGAQGRHAYWLHAFEIDILRRRYVRPVFGYWYSSSAICRQAR